MKRILFLIICFFIFQLHSALSERKFSYLPPMGIGFCLSNVYIEIHNNTNFDSLNIVMEKIFKEKNLCNFDLDIYNMDESLIDSLIYQIEYKHRIVSIRFNNSPIKKIPFSIRKLINLYSISFINCDSIKSLNGFNSTNTMFSITFENCRIKELPEGTEKLIPMLQLMLEIPDDFDEFNLNDELSKFTKRKNIINLFIKYKILKKFPESLFELLSLQTLIFFSNDDLYIPLKFDKLLNLNNLYITNLNDDLLKSLENKEFPQWYGKLQLTEDSTAYVYDKYSFMSKLRAPIYYKDEPQKKSRWNIKKSYMYTYYQDGSRVKNFKFGKYDVKMVPDTVKNTLTFFFNNADDIDSIKMYLIDYNSRKIVKTYNFNKDKAILDLNDFSDGVYFIMFEIKGEHYEIMSFIKKF